MKKRNQFIVVTWKYLWEASLYNLVWILRLANFDSSKAVLSLMLLLCEQLKDLRITSSTLTIFFVLTPLPEMKKMWSMRKRNYKNGSVEKHMIIKHELSKRLYRIWETFYDVEGHQWPEKILSIVNHVKCWKVVTWSTVLLLFLLVRCHPTWHLLSQDNR